MRQTFDELRSSGRLPSPAGIGMEILRLTQEEDCSAGEIANVLRADPALTGRILQLANSAQHVGAHPVTTVNEATVRLGLRAVRSVALGFTLVSGNRNEACEAFDYELFWSESVARAVTTQCLSWRFRVGIPAEVFVLGLLSGVGTLALATAHPEAYDKLLRRRPTTEELVEAELQQFGIHNLDVSQCLLEDWGLPAAFLEALNGLKPGERGLAEGDERPGLREILYVSARVAGAFVRGKDVPIKEPVVQELLNRFPGWNSEDLPTLWEELACEWRRWGSILGVKTRDVPEYRSIQDSQPADPIHPLGELSDEEEDALALGGSLEAPISPEVALEEIHTLRILAVDDDAMSLRLLARHLERAGHEVSTAGDGEEALRVALEENPQIVIADWMMPKLNGLELCKALRSCDAGREMYFILLTGQDQDDQIVEAFRAGVDDYVVKPFKPRLLLARVRAGQRVIRLQLQVQVDHRTMQGHVARLGVLTRKLRQASLTDPLTRLPNRRHAMEELKRHWQFSDRHSIPLSVVMIDIDHFKNFNDTYGHDIGDLVLRESSQTFRQTVRTADMVCRLGGEEFLVILPESDLEGARICADRVRTALHELVIRGPDFEGKVTASFGVATRTPNTKSIDQLLKEADEALYEAKRGGRDRISMHHSYGEAITEKLDLPIS